MFKLVMKREDGTIAVSEDFESEDAAKKVMSEVLRKFPNVVYHTKIRQVGPKLDYVAACENSMKGRV